jgi:cation:H+ antiporter
MPATWSLALSSALFALAVVLILIFGVMMTRVAARLAHRTGLGEAIMGALFVGGSTSLPEIATSTTASLAGHADLAMSNAIGSVAGQTAFLAVADMAYRRVNLEHAAASAENLMLAAFVLVMLAVPLLGLALPEAAIAGVHPASLLMLAVYIQGMRIVGQTHRRPMWLPRPTRETRATDKAGFDHRKRASLAGLWARFLLAAIMTGVGGWLLARTAIPIARHTGLSETLVGGVLTGLSGSLPELITALTAVRMGALTLAVGDILGGNAFDILIVAFSDWVYPGGSLFAAASQQQVYLLALSVLLTAILLMGMLHREKHGFANIGMESVLVLLLYVGALVLLALTS